MRRPLALLVVGTSCFVSGARAEEAVAAPRADVVFAAGDKLHGSLRGGEAHELKVRLAAGDVYSLRVAATGRDETLLLHATVRDPRGREINADARVKHLAQGKRVEIGPFRAPTTGTYVVELLGDGTYANRGSYAAKSKLRLGRTSFALPQDGAPTTVEVPAGATLRLRAKGALTKMTMALPGQESSSFAADDPLVAALRGNGVASSTTGTFWFSAKSEAGASVTVNRRGWKPIDVAAPAFPELPADKIPAGFAPPATPVIPATTTPAAAQTPTAVDVAANGKATLFFTGPSMSAAGPIAVHQMDGATNGVSIVVPDPKTPPAPPSDPPKTPPSDPPVVTPPVVAPPPTPVDPSGIPTTLSAAGKYGGGIAYAAWPASPTPTSLFGLSAFQGSAGWRNAPWSLWAIGRYPNEVVSLLPPPRAALQETTQPQHGDDSDPFVQRTFGVPSWAVGKWSWTGTITTTTRYFVDGHQVASLLAAGGDVTITWSVTGAGTAAGTPWVLTGNWTSVMHAAPGERTTNVVDGLETYVAGDLTETVEVASYKLQSLPLTTALFDAIGTIRNTLSIYGAEIRQTLERTYDDATWRSGIDRKVPVHLKLETVTPLTPPAGVDDWQDFTITLC